MEKVNETVVAKKRGRPALSEEEKARRAKEREEAKKVVNPETGEVEKKKPGRPKKVVEVQKDENGEPIKKKPGRPSKKDANGNPVPKKEKVVKLDENGNPVKGKRGRPALSEEEKAKRAKEREEKNPKKVYKKTNKKSSAKAMTSEGKTFAITDYGFGKTYEVSKVVFENEEGHVVEERVFKNPITMNTSKIGSKMVAKNGTKYVIVSLDESKEDLTFVVKSL